MAAGKLKEDNCEEEQDEEAKDEEETAESEPQAKVSARECLQALEKERSYCQEREIQSIYASRP